jgi:hypothetical protein
MVSDRRNSPGATAAAPDVRIRTWRIGVLSGDPRDPRRRRTGQQVTF